MSGDGWLVVLIVAVLAYHAWCRWLDYRAQGLRERVTVQAEQLVKLAAELAVERTEALSRVLGDRREHPIE